MAVKLTVLSGSMLGQTLETTKDVIRVGAESGSELLFDVLSDPEIDGQQVRFELLDDRWRLVNTSTQPLFINHDLVRDAAGLRSGDLVRLSQDGPDVLFELLMQNASASAFFLASERDADPCAEANETTLRGSIASVNPSEQTCLPLPEKKACAPTASMRQHPQQGNLAPPGAMGKVQFEEDRRPKRLLPVQRRNSSTLRGHKLATVMTLIAVPSVVVAAISIAAILLCVVWGKNPLGIMQAPTSIQQRSAEPGRRIAEGRQPTQSRTIELPTPSTSFENTSKLRNALPLDTGQETLAPPDAALTIKPFAPRIIDLSEAPLLVVDLSSHVIHAENKVVRYNRTPKTQQGVAIDTQTGLLSWTVPSELAGQRIEVPFQVTITDVPEIVHRGVVNLQISSPDSGLAEKNAVFKSIYLIATKTERGDVYLPLGTACSIQQNTLLTSGSVAIGLFEAQKRGWEIVALQASNTSPSSQIIYPITEVKAHRIYLDASKSQNRESRLIQQAYFDLAILSTPRDMESSLSLRQTNQTQLDVGRFTCIGYAVNGKTISGTSSLAPLQEDVKLIARIPPSNADLIQAKPPLLLQFEGAVPANMYGGIFIDANSGVAGIYTFSADLPVETGSPNVCYAAESLPVQSLLSDFERNRSFWMSASEHADQ